jgi:hypothetical protein
MRTIPLRPQFASQVESEQLGRKQNEGESGDWRRIRVRLPFGFLLVERKQFLAVNRDIPRSFDPKADLAAVDVHNRDADIVSDVNLFPELATEY